VRVCECVACASVWFKRSVYSRPCSPAGPQAEGGVSHVACVHGRVRGCLTGRHLRTCAQLPTKQRARGEAWLAWCGLRCLRCGSSRFQITLVRLRSHAARDSERAWGRGREGVCGCTGMGQPMRTSSVLSSWRTRPVCESALGMVIIE